MHFCSKCELQAPVAGLPTLPGGGAGSPRAHLPRHGAGSSAALALRVSFRPRGPGPATGRCPNQGAAAAGEAVEVGAPGMGWSLRSEHVSRMEQG